MAGEWRQTRLGDLVTLRGGLAYDGRLISDCGDALVTMGCVARGERFNAAGLRRYAGNASDLHRLGAGDLVIATRDVTQNRELIGAPAIVPAGLPGRPILATNMYRVINHSEVPTTFLYWLLRSPEYREHIVASAKGTTVVMITKDAVEDFRFRLPPLSEQRAIAHILDTLDDKIELNRRMSQTLEAMARALFKAWFVDFEPVRAKMEGRWQRGQSLPGLPAHLYDLFPDRLADSELGEIPEGWEVVTLPEVIEVNPSRPLRKGEVASYLDMVNMPTRGHAPDQVVDRPFGSGTRFMNGDTLVARITPCLENGKTAFVDFLEDGQIGWGSTEFIVLRPRPPLPEQFGYCLARSEAFREFAIQSMTGTSGRQRVQADSLRHFKLVRASDAVAEAFGRLIKPLFARSSEAVCESRTLVALRDALLPKLIRREIRVRDAERFLKERGL